MRQREYVIQLDGSYSVTQTITASCLQEANEKAEELLDDLFIDTYNFDEDYDVDIWGKVTYVDELQQDYEEDLEEYDV